MTYLFPDSVLLIFCKAPIAGQVKTRLLPALTAEQAADAHRQLTRMTLDRAFQKPLCPVVLCCAPDTSHPFFKQCANAYPLTLAIQHGNDLGARMHHALSAALSRYRHALVIGCDCPSLTPDDLHDALQSLENGRDLVIAPADDGGYVLIGVSTPRPGLFADMVWGTNTVMAETRQRADQAGLNLRELEKQWDVDTIADWKRYLRHASGQAQTASRR